MVESSPILPPNRRGIMTTTTIIQIILGLLLALIIKKFYYSIVNKGIDIDIEKQKKIDETVKAEKEAEKEKADKESYWLIKYQRELKETLDAIERIIQTKGKSYDRNGKFDCHSGDILELAKKLSHFLDKDDKSGNEFLHFNCLLRCYYFISPELKKDYEGLIFYYRKQNDDLQIKQQELEQKQQELELREAKIIKIESAQKILNSELVEKINKEID